jgi:hypothetical protein
MMRELTMEKPYVQVLLDKGFDVLDDVWRDTVQAATRPPVPEYRARMDNGTDQFGSSLKFEF